MKRRLDRLVDQRIGSLRILSKLPTLRSGSYNTRVRMVCQCDCGNRVVIPKAYLLRKGNPKNNCGKCNVQTKIHISHNPEYKCWIQMLHRCSNPKHDGYAHYGGRGIKVCGEWKKDFYQFLADIGKRPSSKHSIDRKDPDGNYEPNNVRWVTDKIQARNKRGSKYIKHPQTGKIVPAAEAAEDMGMRYQLFRKMMIEKGEW